MVDFFILPSWTILLICCSQLRVAYILTISLKYWGFSKLKLLILS